MLFSVSNNVICVINDHQLFQILLPTLSRTMGAKGLMYITKQKYKKSVKKMYRFVQFIDFNFLQNQTYIRKNASFELRVKPAI